MKIQLEACTALDAEALYAFELENRLYFEQSIPSRGEDYYLPEMFKQRHASLLQEQREGISFFYLIKDVDGEILGRINLVDRDITTKRAELGYRIGQNHAGKGIAKEAVQLLIKQCPKLDIKEIQARTTDGNIASQKVLTGSGFQRENTAVEVELNGQRMMLIQFKQTISMDVKNDSGSFNRESFFRIIIRFFRIIIRFFENPMRNPKIQNR